MNEFTFIRQDLCRNCGENPIDEYLYCHDCWEDGEIYRCKIHNCRMEDESCMTDCGEEWDLVCRKCEEESMKSNIAYAEWYCKMQREYYNSPLRVIMRLVW